jgi:DNA-binding NtrC family response regulator
MNNPKKIKLFLVDDDPLFLKNLEIEFSQLKTYEVITFSTGEECLENLDQNPDAVVLDYHLNGIDQKAMNGLETLDKIRACNHQLPVIILSSQDKIEVAVNCMHHHANDYVVKSETSFMRIQTIIASIIKFRKAEKELKWYIERM